MTALEAVIGLAIVLALVVYLLIALIDPERF